MVKVYMVKIKGIIFDMDGVLIDAKEWHYKALNRALKLFGMEINRFDHLRKYDGLPTKTKLEMLSKERDLPLSLHNFISQMKQVYTLEMIYLHCKPDFFHEYALSKLKSNGYKLAVCSNSIRNTVKIMMQKANLEKYLDFYLSNEDVEKCKPDPEIYNKAIGKWGIIPSECLIVEDNENGITAARASGANVMCVQSVDEVNYNNIWSYIQRLEGEEYA